MLPSFLVICLLACLAPGATGTGLGEKTMYEEGAMLDADFEQNEKHDLVFVQDGAGNPIESPDDDKFVELIKRLQVDVVAPSKDLAKMMSVASTKSRATFLQHYERYFNQLDVGSVSRPMLLSYLGLEYAEQEELNSWYAPQRRRISDKLVRSCQSLLAKRAELHAANSEIDNQLTEMMEDKQMQIKLHRAYLTFQNNLNLFMLENYLLLCSRLEPEKLSDELEQSGFLFRKRQV